MKQIFVILISMLFVSLSNTAVDAQNTDSENKIDTSSNVPVKKSFNASSLNELKLTNKHGYINLICWDEEKIEIEVIVHVETRSSRATQELLNFISFRERTYGKKLDFKTVFSNDFYTNHAFTINYNVKAPKRLNLTIANTIGDVRILNSDGQLQLSHSYGNLELRGIATQKAHHLNLAFIEGAIDSIGSVTADISNCTLNWANSKSLKGKTNYSMASFINVKSIKLKSFTDRLTISNTDSLTLKGSQFIGKVEQLNTYGFCELEQGQLTLSTTGALKELTISNKKVKTTIEVPRVLSYQINGEIFNGVFTHPTPEKLQLLKDNNNVSFSGTIGKDIEPQANLILFNKNSSITLKN